MGDRELVDGHAVPNGSLATIWGVEKRDVLREVNDCAGKGSSSLTGRLNATPKPDKLERTPSPMRHKGQGLQT
jgi:hypothetical protein